MRRIFAIASLVVLVRVFDVLPSVAATENRTYNPVADATILSTSPTTNYGAATHIDADNSPVQNFLIRFSATELVGRTIVSAKLRLHCVDTSSKGGDFHKMTDNSWSEQTITWNTAPGFDSAVIASLGAVSPNNWYEVDLTNLLKEEAGSGDGIFSLRVNSTSTDGVDWASKERSATLAPQLVVGSRNPAAPPPAATLTASALSSTSIGLAWTDPSRSATRYEVEHSLDGVNAWLKIADVTGEPSGQYVYNDSSLPPGTTHYYRVRGFNSYGDGQYSNVASATTDPPPSPPAAPSDVTVSTTSTRALVSWRDNSSNEDQLSIERSTDGVQWAEVGRVAKDVTSFLATGLQPATSYSFRVRGWDEGIPGEYSQPATGKTADPIVMTAGDIACPPSSSSYKNGLGTSTACRQLYTSDIIASRETSAVLPLGDLQYENGEYSNFTASYDPSWGRFKAISRPAVGNHDYGTPGAAGYFQYWGAAAGDPAKGYYSFDVGAWHLISLNSNCSQVGGCGVGSPQYQWLVTDLASHSSTFCTLAYWHHPRFNSSSSHTSEEAQLMPFWQVLYESNAELVLTGHDHFYERFAPQTPAGAADATNGIREFVVGTGGRNFSSLGTIAANSQVLENTTFGVLKLDLHSTSYDWQFLPEAGKTFTDSGSYPCH